MPPETLSTTVEKSSWVATSSSVLDIGYYREIMTKKEYASTNSIHFSHIKIDVGSELTVFGIKLQGRMDCCAEMSLPYLEVRRWT